MPVWISPCPVGARIRAFGIVRFLDGAGSVKWLWGLTVGEQSAQSEVLANVKMSLPNNADASDAKARAPKANAML